MKVQIVLAAFLITAVGHVSAARADLSESAYARGQQQLAKADFQGALRSFASAAKADRTNPKYLEEFAVLKQVLTLRNQLDSQADAAKWEYTARALHSYYISHKVYDEALALDHKIHQRLDDAQSASMLAETQLAMNLEEEAVATLGELAESKHTVNTRALLGLALVRADHPERGREIAQSIDVSDDAGPGVTYSAARLNAALDNTQQALTLLRRTFEGISPSRLKGFKQHASVSPEFASLASTPAFANVLKTESKVSESQCSSGSSCANCPMRGQCNGGN